MRVIVQACAAVLICICFGAAAAQAPQQPAPSETTVERQVPALANLDTKIGIYLNVLPDCTSAPLPTIRLVAPPVRRTGASAASHPRLNTT